MITVLVLFYGACIGLAVLVYAKKRDQAQRPLSFMQKMNAFAEPFLAAVRARLKAFYRAHVNMMRVKLIIASLPVAIESIVRDIKTESNRFYFALTHKVRENRTAGQKAAVSFFLKDIADYKNRLTEGRQY